MKTISFILSCFLLLNAVQAQTVRYVKPVASGSGNGSSWANASSSLQDMIDASAAGDEIWVAAGIYKPAKDPFGNANPADPRNKTFYLKNGVKIYGGFNGAETALSQRNWRINLSILSGDIGGAGNADNCYHVVISVNDNNTTILDGFSITKGNANGIGGIVLEGLATPAFRDEGGGIENLQSSSQISNCVITGNNGRTGGGITNIGSAPALMNCFFSGNTATVHSGGIENRTSAATVINCVFTANTSGGVGGSITNTTSSAIITNSVFYNNSASVINGGGGIFSDSPAPVITNCIIRSNTGGNIIGAPSVTYSNIENGYAGTGNTSADPMFVNPSDPDGADNTWGTADDGLKLSDCSIAVDAGNSEAIALTIDLAGQPRKFDVPFAPNSGTGTPPVDMGAYESQSVTPPVPPSAIVYVNTALGTGNDDGSSWPNAFRGADALQKALDRIYCQGNEIWVAAGTYKPTKDPFDNTSPDNLRDKTFYLRDGIKIYGGFNGTENLLTQRNWQTNVTILSGDIGRPNVNTDNSYHVLLSVNDGNATVLDGFTITRGNASGSGGFSLEGSGFTIFRVDGSGINNISSSLTIANCIFSGNSARASGTIINTSSSAVITGCLFSANSAGNGGGIYNNLSSSVTQNCIFSGNTARSGAGVYNTASSPAIINCVFSANAANNTGGGLYIGGSTPVITNCTFFGNTSRNGAGLYNIQSNPVITNSIIRGDIFISSGSPVFTYSSTDQIYPGTGNTTADPMFVNSSDPDGADNIWGTPDDGLRLSDCSSSIDAGNSAAITLTTDAAGQPRKFDVLFIPNSGSGTPPVDMGAYESQSAVTPVPPANIVYVNTGLASGNDDGSSWANAFRGADALQKALDNIYCSGNEIWVTAGTYKPTKDPFYNTSPANPRDKTFYLRDGIKIYGGFNGTETLLTQRNWRTNVTILSGDIGTPNVNTDNSYHVVVSVSDGAATILDGFTITGGNANGTGGFILEGSGITTFRGEGAGMNNISSSTTITNCIFSGNTTSSRGGGMQNTSSSPAITNTVFSGNTADEGGGIYNLNNSNPSLHNCVFTVNTAGSNGGGITNDGSSPAIRNTVFSGNSATNIGGGIYNLVSSPVIINCTLNGNTAGTGGSMYNFFDAFPVISNCIVRSGNIFNDQATPVITYSNIQGGFAGTGNINANPQFINISDPDGADNIWGTPDDGLRLSDCSSSIDAGNSAAITLTTDAAGQPRKFDVPFLPNTGSGTPPVDMGAYENQSAVPAPPSAIVYVNTNLAAGNDDGSSWANAFRGADALQKALENIYCIGNEIWVAAGTYKPSKVPSGNPNPPDLRDKTFYLRDGIKIYGGFNGTETLLSQRNWRTNVTILSGDIGTGGLKTDNSYHVVLAENLTTATRIDGFTITDGYANGIGQIGEGPDSPARNDGGGLNSVLSSLIVANCTFSGNEATHGGGGLYDNLSTSPGIANCIFSGNIAQDGGGIFLNRSTSSVINCVFAGNTASNNGGGIYNVNCPSVAITNSVFSANSANQGGGAFIAATTAAIANSVFSGNTANTSGGGIFNFLSSPSVTNSIIRGSSGGSIANNPGSNPVVAYSNIEGGYAGTGNINADPLFVNAADPDGADNTWATSDDGLKLQCGSPSINAGNNSLIPVGITTDITGSSRIQDGIVDMGAYEGAGPGSGALASANISDTKIQSGTVVYGSCSGLICTVNSTGASPISGSTTASVWIETSQPVQFVKRHYQVAPSANAATATGRVTLYFTQAEFDAFNAVNTIKLPAGPADVAGISNLLVEKRSGISNDGSGLPASYSGSIININPVDADIVWNSSNTRWEVSFDVTGFSGFFVKVIGNALPLKWLRVNGTINAQQQAVINWEVQEVNVAYYEVEKSTDGIRFTKIGRISSRGDGQHEYNLLDPAIVQGEVYYRIYQADLDGRSSYSSIIRLSNKVQTGILVYPVPFKDGFTVVVSGSQAAVLLDAGGRLIKTIILKEGTNYIPCSNLPAGMYLLRTADGKVQKLLKE